MSRKAIINALLMGAFFISLNACRSIPKGAIAVDHFDKKNYLGKWYEIARLDYYFERNLNNTTAEYSIKNKGRIRVENKGFNDKKQKWQKAIGKAKFAGKENIAKLKVSFFGPFYAGYNVVAIDKEYKYALVLGSSLKYMWILSRKKTIPNNVRIDYVNKAKEIGYKVSDLLWITHDKD